ncbi:MAG: hypothetical protein QXM23_05080 [Archaeoglobaceae archaeon]
MQQGNYALASNNVDNLALKSDPLQLWQSYDSNGKIEDLEPIAAIMDWSNNRFSDLELINVIIKWLSRDVNRDVKLKTKSDLHCLLVKFCDEESKIRLTHPHE